MTASPRASGQAIGHASKLTETTRMGLYERRIVTRGPRRLAALAHLAQGALNATDAAMAATIEAGIGKAALLKAIDGCCAPPAELAGRRHGWRQTPPKRPLTKHGIRDAGEDPGVE